MSYQKNNDKPALERAFQKVAEQRKTDRLTDHQSPNTVDQCTRAQDELTRLRWLIEWVNEHGSFRTNEWPVWEKLQESQEPWNDYDE